MSPPSTNKIINASNKHHASALTSKTLPKKGKSVKKATITYSPPPSPCNDFTLYPDEPVVHRSPSDRRARARRVREELISDGLLLPSAKKGDEVSREELTPLQRATKRRNKADHLPVIHQQKEDSQQRELRLPPAPSPPRLATPDLDEIEEDLWSCCSWGESSIESYIAATQSSQENSSHKR